MLINEQESYTSIIALDWYESANVPFSVRGGIGCWRWSTCTIRWRCSYCWWLCSRWRLSL